MALNFLNNGYFAGKVGIGIQSPAAKLHVNPTTTDEIAIAINGTQNYSAGEFQRIAAGDASSINRLSIGFGYDNPTDWAIRYSSYGRHEFYTGNDWGNAANTEKMVITSAGNVGIGTGSPDNLLHVQGSNNPRIDLGEDTNNKGWMRWNNADNYIDFTTRVGGTYYADTLVLRNGNVGIGTTSPAHKLDVNSGSIFLDSDWPVYFGSGSVLIEGNSSGTILRSNASAGFKWTDGGNTHMTLDTNGNLGIGTTSPSERLHVHGKAFINGQIYGGFGAVTTNGTLDWNDSTNARSGSGYTLLRGNATNGPAGTEYYHPFSWEYSSYDNDGNMTQFAIPYSTNNTGMYFRNRYSGSWSSWAEIVTTTKTLPGGPYLPLAGGTMTGNTLHGDGVKSMYGAGNDLQIYHNGSNSLIEQSGTGKLILDATSTGINIQSGSGETRFTKSGASSEIKVDDASQVNKVVLKASGNSYFNGGNVGIGTTSPGYRLEVDGGIGDGVKIKAGNAASKDSLLVSTNNDVSKFLVQGDGKVIINSSTGISGRTENFQVFGKQIITNTGTDGPVLYLGYNSSGSNTIQLGRGRTADGLSYMDFNGEVMSAGQFGFRIIRYSGQNASTELNHIGTGAFKLTCTNSADIILNPNSGSVGISQTNPSHKLDVTGDGRFTSTVTATNFILSSDERLKENVEKVCDNRVEADWKTFELKTDKGQKRYGVIAQELEKTNPEFVREDSEGFKSVAYIDLLIAKIAELEARLEKLEK